MLCINTSVLFLTQVVNVAVKAPCGRCVQLAFSKILTPKVLLMVSYRCVKASLMDAASNEQKEPCVVAAATRARA